MTKKVAHGRDSDSYQSRNANGGVGDEGLRVGDGVLDDEMVVSESSVLLEGVN